MGMKRNEEGRRAQGRHEGEIYKCHWREGGRPLLLRLGGPQLFLFISWQGPGETCISQDGVKLLDLEKACQEGRRQTGLNLPLGTEYARP